MNDCARGYVCGRCRKRHPQPTPRRCWKSIDRWRKRIVATSNSPHRGIDVVIPLPFGDHKIIYSEILKILASIGIQQILTKPRILVQVALELKHIVLEVEQQEIIGHGIIALDRVKQWIIQYFWKHAMMWSQVWDSSCDKTETNVHYQFKCLSNFVDPSEELIEEELNSMWDPDVIKMTVCVNCCVFDKTVTSVCDSDRTSKPQPSSFIHDRVPVVTT